MAELDDVYTQYSQSVENLCEAMKIISLSVVDGVSYDKTLTCTITDVSNRDNGEYTVTDGSVTFKAYSDITNYNENTVVYVTIPQGDFSLQKIIIGKKADSENAEPFTYKNPLDIFVDFSNNLNSTNNSYSLLANNPNLLTTEILSLGGLYGELDESKLLAYDSTFTRLGVRANFKSFIGNAKYGDYGLKITIYDKYDLVISKDEENKEEWKVREHIYYFSSTSDMYGNPYNYESFYTLSKVFDITDLGIITGVKVEFYQEPGSFKDINNAQLSYITGENLYADNLFTNDIYIALGYDLSSFTTDYATLYSFDKSTYIKTKSDEKNTKNINLCWIHIDDDGNPVNMFEDTSSVDDYEIRWYRYKLGAPSADEYSGVYWEKLNEEDDTKSFFQKIIPDKTLAEEKVKVIIFYNNNRYYANEIIFTNEEEVPNYATVDSQNALTIQCDDGTYGNYRIYNEGNSLIDLALSKIQRTLSAHFDLADYPVEDNNTLLTDAESITWEFPASATMLSFDYDSSNYTYNEKSDTISITKTPNSDGEIDPYINYYIDSYFSLSKSVNNVSCYIVKDGISYLTLKEFTFGLAGTTGTDCTLVLDIDNNESAFTVGDKKSLFVTARLYDAKNQECDLLSNPNVSTEWEWYKSYNAHATVNRYTNNNVTYKYKAELKPNGVTINDLYILQCTVKGWGDYDLIAYLSIPVRSNSEYRYISGATLLIYDTAGNISYYKLPYRIWTLTAKDWVELVEGSWSIYTPDTSTKSYYYPELKATNSTKEDKTKVFTGYILKPLDIYFDIPVFGVKYGSNWTQPILMILNTYPSAMINEWDGKTLTIDNDSGSIEATRLAAGKKDSENRFSGVLIGDWKEGTDSTTTSGTGIYGFNAGQMSYAFKDDGTVFIGKSGRGRIQFDGNNGIIKSSSYDTAADSGMKIDIDDGIIDIRGAVVDKNKKLSSIKISSASPYLKIVSDTGTTLLNIGLKEKDNEIVSDYYLQSNDFNTSTLSGIKFDLGSGKITGYNFNIKAIKSNSTDYLLINSSALDYPFNINDAFKVDWDGTLYATGGTINGLMTVNGTLDGAYIEGAIISGGYIYGSTIKGPTISGSTISGSSINVTIRENATTTEYTSRKDNTLKKVDTGLEKSGGINFYWYDEEEQGKSGTTYILGQMGAVKGKNSAKLTTYNVGISSNTSSIILSTTGTNSYSSTEGANNIALRTEGSIFIDGDTNVYIGESGRKIGKLIVYADEVDFTNVTTQTKIYALFA